MALSASTKYYRRNPEAKAKKDAYNTKYHDNPKRRAYRAALGRARYKKKLKVGDKRDVSHTKKGRLVLEHQSKNRARQGSNGKSTLK